MTRLSTRLDALETKTASAFHLATFASAQGQDLQISLRYINEDLRREKSLSPGWKRMYDSTSHFLLGGEPSKSALIDRDLKLTQHTILTLGDLAHRLEDSRTATKNFRDQLGDFEAGVMGFHLGAEPAGMSTEEEIGVLSGVVEELGNSVGAVKRVSWHSSAVPAIEGFHSTHA